MRLAVFTQVYTCGGIDTFLTNLVNAWPQETDEIVILANPDYPGIELIAKRATRPITIQHVSADHYEKLSRVLPATRLRKPFMPFLRIMCWFLSLATLYNLWRHVKADALLVVNGGHPGSDACRAAPVAWRLVNKQKLCIYNVHNLAPRPRWFELLVEALLDVSLVKTADVLVAVSRACARTLLPRRFIASSGKLGFIFNGLTDPAQRPDLEPGLAAAALRNRLGWPSDSIVSLQLGSFEARKGHDFVMKAFRRVRVRHPKARLLFCGAADEGELAAMRRELASQGLADVAVCLPFESDPLPLIAGSDVLCVGSQTFESFGLVAAEAMSLSCPVLSTDTGGLPEVVENGQGGFVAPRQDEAAFACKLDHLLSAPELRAEQGRLGRKRFLAHFQAQRMSSAYSRLLLRAYERADFPTDEVGIRDFNLPKGAGAS